VPRGGLLRDQLGRLRWGDGSGFREPAPRHRCSGSGVPP